MTLGMCNIEMSTRFGEMIGTSLMEQWGLELCLIEHGWRQLKRYDSC